MEHEAECPGIGGSSREFSREQVFPEGGSLTVGSWRLAWAEQESTCW